MSAKNLTKAQLIKANKYLQHQVAVLETQKERIKEEFNELTTEKACSDELLERTGRELSHRTAELKTCQGELREREQELNNTRTANANLLIELRKVRESNSDLGSRNSSLERLLIHTGKTVGALSDIAKEKYKHDDLPF